MSWFYRVEALEFDGSTLTLAFANDFAARWARERFSTAILACIHDVVGPGASFDAVSRETALTQESAPPQQHDSTQAAVHPQPSMSEAELRSAIGGHVASMAHSQAPRVAQEYGIPEQQLNPRYRFDTFVIGEGSQLAHAAALSVAEAPGQSYNPLFIHGGTGLGKTHLLHAIGHFARETRPGIRVAYATAEQFVNRFIHAIQHQQRDQRERFKSYFRGIDLLLMDDVQFLSGKGSSTQEELFHTFNALHESGRQVVLTSDCPPSQIPKLEDRLRSRFSWGLITDIEAPDHETRVAILRKRTASDGLRIEDAVLDEIAERVSSNVRELEGALTRVIGLGSLTGREIDVALCRQALEGWIDTGSSGQITIDRIQHVVCDHFELSRDDLVGRRRTAQVVRPRQIAMYLSRVLLGASSTQVGQRFGGRDHSTVIHAEQQIDKLIRNDRDVFNLVEALTATLRGTQPESVRDVR